jgi:hypothetical protein
MHRPDPSSIFSSYWFPAEPEDQFHLVLVILHGIGAFGAFLMSMICNGVAHGTQRGMLTVATSAALGNFTRVRAYRAAYPWSEDGEFETHLWNPYFLIVAFEWITAGFALCNLWHWLSHPLEFTQGWMAFGALALGAWVLRHNGATPFCFAMIVILLISFIAAAAACVRYFQLIQAQGLVPASGPPPSAAPPNDLPEETPLTVQGRLWYVPRSVAGLKPRPRRSLLRAGEAAEAAQQPPVSEGERPAFIYAMDAVGFRYVEYCITAPLLFLAVMCLLVSDAPSWLFLIGYWMIQACCALGIALHYNLTKDMLANHGSRWFQGLLATGTW